jgi:rRNA pseudouridine-1189 N-methylase Emg1 (Nep1/Mra1 family)
LDRKNNNIKNKNDGILPNLSLDTLKNVKDSEYNYLKDKNNKFRVRIRINRSNKISVDRYIELKDDFNPFHDSYNDIINDYKKYDNDGMALNSLEKKNFENLLNSYNLNRVKNLPLIESDDDSITLNNDIKHFSNSYKQFLKAKRAHT